MNLQEVSQMSELSPSETKAVLNAENFSRGFLVDEELMAGITTDPESPESYVAFILKHTTGEYLGYEAFPNLEPALAAINQIRRSWTFEKLGGGCGGACGKEGGSCGISGGGGGCKAGKCGTGAC